MTMPRLSFSSRKPDADVIFQSCYGLNLDERVAS
jgi:hypothetical protein